METVSKTYNTRKKRRSVESPLKSRVDWKRTKMDISIMADSDESVTSEEENVEETEEESDDSSCTDKPGDQPEERSLPEEDGEEGRIKKPRLKNKSAMIGSDSSSDSDGPGERLNVKRICVINEDDSDEAVEPSDDEETKTQLKKQNRLEKLKLLVKRQRSRNRTTSHESTEESPHDECAPPTPETSAKNEDSDHMSDFIVEDDENNDGDAENPTTNYKELFRKHHISLSSSHDLSSHLKQVIEAFLINIADEKFLKTLYEGARKKRYAKDMLRSLNYLEERIINPRLEKLITSCRWTTRYKERVNSYPNLHVKRVPPEQTSCDACGLNRHCSYLVTLSGETYDKKTIENDDFLKNDKQFLVIGTVCASRTEAYHQLRHYKYCLYQRCIPYINKTEEKSAKEIVKLALSEMEAEDFFGQEVLFLEGYLNEADYFEEERMDSLYS